MAAPIENTDNQSSRSGRRDLRWRIAAWALLATMMLTPWIAMQFTAEVTWTGFDFAVFAVMLLIPYAILELVLRISPSFVYRAGAVVGLGAGFLLVWSNLAVGIVGSENNPFNQWFFVSLIVAVLGSFVARFKARGMAISMLTAGGVFVAVCIAALATRQALPPVACAILLAPWLLSAWLFNEAARKAG